MPLLTKVNFTLPDIDDIFTNQFLQYLSPKGELRENSLNLRTSDEDFFPKTSFEFKGNEQPYVTFVFDDRNEIKVPISNTTNITKQSPYTYSYLALEDLLTRIKPFSLIGLDHTGFNLPYFEGIHPQILELREKLKDACLYHTFPKHLEDAPWDFIIPGTKEEINRSVSIDYQKTRKPKIEIVSFENSSTPLIQIDIQLQAKYEDLVKVFPEAIHVPEIRNMWIYLKNNFGIDICFVLNEASENDWSYQFKNERLS